MLAGILLSFVSNLFVKMQENIITLHSTLHLHASVPFLGTLSKSFCHWEKILSFNSGPICRKDLVCIKANRKSKHCLPCKIWRLIYKVYGKEKMPLCIFFGASYILYTLQNALMLQADSYVSAQCIFDCST